ncbi:hypothetical protein [Rhizobium sp. CFBP 8752]|uniref:hypothetical protein n=1 Tax=Rhizobium sp. CFBP 8752 TaxID=2775301 RepID=UPI00406D1CED
MTDTPVADCRTNHRSAGEFRRREQSHLPMVFSACRESVMIANDVLNEDVSDFATRLEAMTSDEVFAAMSLLEKHSEDNASDREETLSRITLVEEEIERRFPGQMLTPYRDWKKTSL